MSDKKIPTGTEGFEEIDLRRYFQVLLRRWKMILGITCAAALGAFLISLTLPPVYEAKALVAIVKAKSDITFEPKFKTIGEEELAVLGRLWDKWYEARRKALAEMVQNAAIAREVVNRLKGTFEEKEAEPSYLMEKVEGKVGTGGGDIIAICVKWNDPQEAALIANTWARLYEEHINKLYATAPLAYAKSIEDELKKAKKCYLSAQEALERFISQNKIKEIERLIAEKREVISALQRGRKVAVNALVDEKVKAQQRLISAYLSAQAKNRLLTFEKEQEGLRKLASAYLNAHNNSQIEVFQKQLESQLATLTSYYKNKQKLQLLLEDAAVLRDQISKGGKGAAISNSLAIILLKAQVFASSASLPGTLNIEIQELPKLSVEDLVKDLDMLTVVIKNRLKEIDEKISMLSQQIVVGSSFKFFSSNEEKFTAAFQRIYPKLFQLGKLSSLSDKVPHENDLQPEIEIKAEKLMRLEGLENLPKQEFSGPLKEAIENLEKEIRILEARLEQEKARKKELIEDRDLTYNTYIALKRKAAEVRLVTRVPGTEVRFAVPAGIPLHPVSPRKFLNMAIAGILGLMVAVLGVFFIEFLQESQEEDERKRKA